MPGSRVNGSGPVLEPIHKGWLTKSPPEPKFMSPWRYLVRAKWRRRYFVLHKPPSSLPDHFALDYFEDDTLNKRLGTIDLELTEEIISPLNSSQYDYLFLIKTKFKRKDRRYFLAVDSEDEMNKWIDCLCQVCGLKEQDEVPDPANLVPPTEEPLEQSRPSLTGGTLTRQQSDSDTAASLAAQSTGGGSYVKLYTCFSKTEDENVVNLDISDSLSIPDVPPPPVPNEDYDVPPRRDSGEDFYKVPPRRDEVYDVPPSHDRLENPNDFYDVPPPPVRTESDIPPKPPKPRDVNQRVDSQYINLPSVSPVSDEPPRPPPRPSVEAVYDVPPPNNQSILAMSPPPPCVITASANSHSYVNTHSTDRYTHMNRAAQEQPTYDVLYTKSPKKENGVPPIPKRQSESEEVYVVPPSNKPVNPAPPPTPVRPENTLTKYSKPIEQNTCEVFSTSRTTSFRRTGVKQTPSPRPRSRGSGQGSMSRDASFGLGIPIRTGSSCSSSEDDDDSSSLDRSSSSQVNAGPTPPRRAVPSGGKPHETELQYLDLDLTSRQMTTPEKRVPKPAAPSNSATEYKEIDFIKTNALCKAKQNLESEKERKNSDAGILGPHH